MDISLPALWRCWQVFRKGKRRTFALDHFTYHLERHLRSLHEDLSHGTYRHGPYRTFTVNDTKKRSIAVAPLRDRIIHRLLYDYLVKRYDPIFLFDAWSCRKGKGLTRCIDRAQNFLRIHHQGFFWRADIHKFFDYVDHDILKNLLRWRMKDERALQLLDHVIDSYSVRSSFERERELADRWRGIPIGNLTSQIFSNIYLHELDRFVKHTLHVRHYLRYGDDFVIFTEDSEMLLHHRQDVMHFLEERLHLRLHPHNDILLHSWRGLYWLGFELFPTGRRLTSRNWKRITRRLTPRNVASYSGLVRFERRGKRIRQLHWETLQ